MCICLYALLHLGIMTYTHLDVYMSICRLDYTSRHIGLYTSRCVDIYLYLDVYGIYDTYVYTHLDICLYV